MLMERSGGRVSSTGDTMEERGRVGHIILLGDSVFDNLKYVVPEPAVLTQLQELLPGGWTATLRAVDGAVTYDVPGQLRDLPV